jgi:hypothetical protein
LLPAGTVLVAGGESNGSSAEIYNPVTGTFSLTGSMAFARERHTATLLADGTVLVGAGTNESADLASAELYNSATGTFSATGSMATARSAHSATLLADGTVLIAGGVIVGPQWSTASAEIYAGSFSPTASMATPRGGHTATLLADGTVLVVRGRNRETGTLMTAEIYNPATRTWR